MSATEELPPIRPDEMGEEHFHGLYRLALRIWQRDVKVARRKRDRALVLVKQVGRGGDWIGTFGSDGCLWIEKVKDRPRGFGIYYRIVAELDAPREHPSTD